MAKRKIALSGPGAINAARNARRGVVDGPPGASGHNALELIGAHKRLLRSSSHAVAAVHRTPFTADNCIAPTQSCTIHNHASNSKGSKQILRHSCTMSWPVLGACNCDVLCA